MSAPKKLALFRFDASLSLGAGHAIRSCVIADALIQKGWKCKIISNKESYSFLPELNHFVRIDPERFWSDPVACDLLVIDHYNLDEKYERHFSATAKSIMVLDDLSNRKHSCDILLDQTYIRNAKDYQGLVPEFCKVLTGSQYALIRQEFVVLRDKALRKRLKTKKVERILVSLGGGDNSDYILKILNIIQYSGFTGFVDIALGFCSYNYDTIEKYIETIPFKCQAYVNANMPKLIYDADLAIGAAGSSMWERCVLGLPTIMFILSEDQVLIAEKLHNHGVAICLGYINEAKDEHAVQVLGSLLSECSKVSELQKNAIQVCNGHGIKFVMETIDGLH